jgi:heterodisulfide reductase subunit C
MSEIQFGYTINKDRQIEYDKNDFHLAEELSKREPTFNVCISCGTCSATCTAAGFTNFNIRKLTTLIKRGEIAEVKEEIKKCMLCGKCLINCPRDLNTRNMVIEISRILNDL